MPMANAAALINEGLWRKDKDFQRLSRFAQCTFCQVLACKDLDTAGVLTLHLELLAKGCEELTIEQLMADFAELEAARFLFVDYDTDELFIRSYVRNVSSKNRNSWFSVPRNSGLVASQKIRRELAIELRRLRRKDADVIADDIDPVETPSGAGLDPVSTPSRPGTPSRPRPDGDSQVQVLVLESPSVVGHLGERRPECRKHKENSTENCIDCMRRREWDDDQVERLAADELELKRRVREIRENCPVCSGTNWIPNTEPAQRCDHGLGDAANA